MKSLSRLLIGLSVLAASAAYAQEVRIGFVSTDRVFKEANSAKASQARLEQEFSKREKELNDLGSSIKAGAEKLEREAPTLSETQRATRQKQLVEQDREFQRKRREFQEDLNARRNEELEQVRNKANRVIKQFATDEKYDLILQDAVWIAPKHDITDKVIKAMNAGSGK